MKTKNLTRFLFAAKASSLEAPALNMTMIVRGTFRLAPGEPLVPVKKPAGQRTLNMEAFAGTPRECVYPSDFADFKLNAEALLVGSCHTPGGKPALDCPVLFRVGAWSKLLRVVGKRTWTGKLLGSAISDAEPFTKMPLTWANAFGGPSYAANPVGRGLDTPDLPTVELAGDVLRGRGDRPGPAGFGPIDPESPDRKNKIGKDYGAGWRKNRAPHWAADFDYKYFRAAAADQQIEGYLRGDEELTLQNLHPKQPVWKTQLPGLRVRAFVNDIHGRFREVPMFLDTLLVDLKKGRLELTWRGIDSVHEDDLADVKTTLIASEKLTAERRPEEHYRAILTEFEQKPVDLEKRWPAGLADAAARRQREQDGERIPDAPGDEALDPLSRLLKRKLGTFREKDQAGVREGLKGAVSDERVAKALEASVAAAEMRIADTPPTAVTGKPGSFPELGLRRMMRRMMANSAELNKALDGKKEVPEAEKKKVEALGGVPFDPRWKKLDPSYTPPVEPLSTDEPAPGADLRERDFTRQDLRGKDLTGANLEGAIFTRADLRGAKLKGAKLRGAILFHTLLDGADLTRADLTRANAARASLIGADLRGATLNETFFEKAILKDADLSEAKGEWAVFARADLTRAKLRGAVIRTSKFREALLTGADFSTATLRGSGFMECTGEGASFARADVTRASFERASLPGANFGEAQGERLNMLGATVDGGDFTLLKAPGAILDGLSAVGARFFGADLRESRLLHAKLDRAELTKANLFRANLSRASLNGTGFRDASLYGAQLTRARGKGADFLGANLKASTLENA